jgi:putative serine protease PepD
VDELWEEHPARRIALAPLLAVLLALAAGALALFVWREQRQASSDRAALEIQIAALRQRVTRLSGHDATLASRLGSAEKTLRRKDAGIAPLASRVLRSVFTVETDSALGTGFVAWQDADASYLLTAAHVVDSQASGEVTITRKGGSWSGTVEGIDAKDDLAVIRVNGRPSGAAPLWQDPRATHAEPGDQLLLVGSPFGLQGTVTSGVVSRVTKKFVQTDAAANPGNSGGPAIDATGHVVGVVLAIIRNGQNITFAVRVDRACAKLRSC